MALRNQPYIPLYIQDIMTDEKLNECSASTHGIYIKGIMCLMHKSENYGKILLKQKYKQNKSKIKALAYQLVKHLPYTETEIENALTELVDEKVCHFEGDYLCQKRMVKDNELSLVRAKAGKKGGDKTKFAIAKVQANTESEYETEYEGENDIEYKINIKFEKFWNLYDKKVGEKTKLIKKWVKLKDIDRELIMDYIPKYIQSQPDKKFRKDPMTFFNNKSWLDEIITDKETKPEPLQKRVPANIIK